MPCDSNIELEDFETYLGSLYEDRMSRYVIWEKINNWFQHRSHYQREFEHVGSIVFKSPLDTFWSGLFYGRWVVMWISIALGKKYAWSHCSYQIIASKVDSSLWCGPHENFRWDSHLKEHLDNTGSQPRGEMTNNLLWVVCSIQSAFEAFVHICRSFVPCRLTMHPKTWASFTTPFKLIG